MRTLSILALVLASLTALNPARAQTYDEAAIEAHLRQMYHGYQGDKLFRWELPIRYIVAGVQDEQIQRLIDEDFAYLRELTGLDIRKADPTEPKWNFVIVLANPIAQVIGQKTLRAVFGEPGQPDAEYKQMLERMDRLRLHTVRHKRTADSIAFYAVLVNPTVWRERLLMTRILGLMVYGLTETEPSNVVHPSIWNTGENLRPATRLPSIDEAYLKALYRGRLKTGMPIEDAVHELALAIASDLND